jgi:hypothetical protein
MPVVKTYESKLNPDYYTQKQALAKVFRNLKKDYVNEVQPENMAGTAPASLEEDVFQITSQLNEMTYSFQVLDQLYSDNTAPPKVRDVTPEVSKLNTVVSQFNTVFRVRFQKNMMYLNNDQKSTLLDALNYLDTNISDFSEAINDMRGEERLQTIGRNAISNVTTALEDFVPMLKQLSGSVVLTSSFAGAPELEDDGEDMEGAGHISGSTWSGGGRTGATFHQKHALLSPAYKHHYLSSLSKRNI